MQTIAFAPLDFDAAAADLAALRDRPLPDLAALTAWIADWGRLHDQLDEARVRREIAKDQALDDAGAQAAHRAWIEAEPRLKAHYFALQEKLARHPDGDRLDPSYRQFLETTRNQVALYHPDIAALEAECGALVADYYRLRGAQAEQCDYAHPDRATREATFRAAAARRQQDQTAIDAIADQLLQKRAAIASGAGVADFRAFRFRQLNRFSYDPADCLRLCDAVEAVALPLLARLDARRAAKLGVDALRPWDFQAEPADVPARESFAESSPLLPGVRRILSQLHPAFAADLDFLVGRGLLDIEPRAQKSAFVGYQQLLRGECHPFIFANIRANPSDLLNLFHELGHACHSLAFRDLPLCWNRDYPLEFGETAANGFQLICGGLLADVFYGDGDARRARALQLEALVDNLVYTARGETFLHWAHAHPDAGADERGRQYLAISRRFGRRADWSGLEDYHSRLYHYEIPHFFFAPFYWIEYLYGQLGALQLQRRFRQDPQGAMEALRRGMALGSSVPVPALFAAAGIEFAITPELLEGLLEDLEEELAAL